MPNYQPKKQLVVITPLIDFINTVIALISFPGEKVTP